MGISYGSANFCLFHRALARAGKCPGGGAGFSRRFPVAPHRGPSLGRVIERTDDTGAWSTWASETVLSLRERYVDTVTTAAPSGVRLYRERGQP